MIVFDNVVFKYPYEKFALLNGASFTLQSGVNTVLCDRQSGKTTICRLICNLLKVNGGNIIIGEVDRNSITRGNLGILYLSEKPTFFERRSVLYNVAYPLKVRKVSKSERLSLSKKILADMGISDVNAKVSALSVSERKKVAVARGLTVKRKIVLFDDFLEDYSQIGILDTFDCETKVIFTSDANLAAGNCVVLDGGVCVYQGDAATSAEVVRKLEWF